MNEAELDAGDFKQWLNQIQRGASAEVPCGSCNACCHAAYFIHVAPTDADALDVIPQPLLFPAPGREPGHMIMGYTQTGACPMLRENRCSIYPHRPQTCRDYDCRIFAAAGISAGDADKTAVNAQIQRWRFSYSDQRDKLAHDAIRRAASFLSREAHRFETGLAPTNPTQLALLAIRIHPLFLSADHDNIQPLVDAISQIVRDAQSA